MNRWLAGTGIARIAVALVMLGFFLGTSGIYAYAAVQNSHVQVPTPTTGGVHPGDFTIGFVWGLTGLAIIVAVCLVAIVGRIVRKHR